MLVLFGEQLCRQASLLRKKLERCAEYWVSNKGLVNNFYRKSMLCSYVHPPPHICTGMQDDHNRLWHGEKNREEVPVIPRGGRGE